VAGRRKLAAAPYPVPGGAGRAAQRGRPKLSRRGPRRRSTEKDRERILVWWRDSRRKASRKLGAVHYAETLHPSNARRRRGARGRGPGTADAVADDRARASAGAGSHRLFGLVRGCSIWKAS
jgi:hypothetical protein